MSDLVTIRNFVYDDIDFIYNNWAENCTWGGCKFEKDIDSIKKLIDEWKTKVYQSHYFEQFVILCNNIPVGMVSLYEKSDDEVSVGIYIEQNNTHKGIGTKTYQLIEEEAKKKKYKYLSAGVLEDNIPSVNFHLKMGFNKESTHLNSKGKNQIRFIKRLS